MLEDPSRRVVGNGVTESVASHLKQPRQLPCRLPFDAGTRQRVDGTLPVSGTMRSCHFSELNVFRFLPIDPPGQVRRRMKPAANVDRGRRQASQSSGTAIESGGTVIHSLLAGGMSTVLPGNDLFSSLSTTTCLQPLRATGPSRRGSPSENVRRRRDRQDDRQPNPTVMANRGNDLQTLFPLQPYALRAPAVEAARPRMFGVDEIVKTIDNPTRLCLRGI
nr:hypothetical protein CFP56_56887 [Quercus suber]